MNNSLKNISFLVEEEATAISLVKRALGSQLSSLVYKLFRKKRVIVNQKSLRYYQYRLKKGDSIEILNSGEIALKQKRIQPKEKTNFATVGSLPPSINLKIEYEDDNLLLVVKDHNVEVHNDLNPLLTLDNLVLHHLSKSSFKMPNLFSVTSSNRLDKLTKGFVVYPKNPLAKKILHNSFGNKDLLVKKYLAICENSKRRLFPSVVSGFIHKNDSLQRMIFQDESSGNENEKTCALEIKEISRKDSFSLLEISLLTGRKHQIRSILSFLGTPVVGDKKYGSKILVDNQIKLYAFMIKFVNLPKPLSYLNGKTFEMKELKEKLILRFNSITNNILPKKLLSSKETS